jgi:hypothetical protein
MMNAYITSLDNPEKRLGMTTGEGSQVGDIFLNTDANRFWMAGVQLIAAGIGTGNYHYTCPIYKGAQDIFHLFTFNKQDTLNTKPVDRQLFDFSLEDVITFGQPEWYLSSRKKMDFLLSKAGFFGVRTRQDYGQEYDLISQDHVVWLSGPDNKDYATMFGVRAYQKRRKLFGAIYNLANADPIQMANPIFPGENGMKCISKGGKNALH